MDILSKKYKTSIISLFRCYALTNKSLIAVNYQSKFYTINWIILTGSINY